MFVIVVGCGRVGSELAFRLFQAGHQVAVIDEVGKSFEALHPDYRGRTIEGEVLSEEVLKRSGIESADGLAAVTNSDSVNAVVGHVARTVYNVPNVVVRNYNPRWLPMHDAFGLQVVSSTGSPKRGKRPTSIRLRRTIHAPRSPSPASAASR